MHIQVTNHVITLNLRVVAHHDEARGTNLVTLTDNLPGNGAVNRAQIIAVRVASDSGGTSVNGDIRSHYMIFINGHNVHNARVEVRFVIDNSEYLSMDTDVVSNRLGSSAPENFQQKVAEGTIIKMTLLLVDSATCYKDRATSINFIHLSTLHSSTVCPLMWFVIVSSYVS